MTKWKLILLAVASMAVGCASEDELEPLPRFEGEELAEPELDPREPVDEMCTSLQCEPVEPGTKTYQITIHDVHVNGTKLGGRCWDEPDCGAPDPFVVVRLTDNGYDRPVIRTAPVEDSFTAYFAASEQVTIGPESVLTLELWDADDPCMVGVVDFALVCEVPLTDEVLASGKILCGHYGSFINATILPVYEPVPEMDPRPAAAAAQQTEQHPGCPVDGAGEE